MALHHVAHRLPTLLLESQYLELAIIELAGKSACPHMLAVVRTAAGQNGLYYLWFRPA